MDAIINPFEEEEPEEIKEIEHEHDPLVNVVIKYFQENCVNLEDYENEIYALREQFTRDISTFILNPTQINSVAKGLIYLDEGIVLPHFITFLIQRSYDSGNDNFFINAEDHVMYFAFHGLKGRTTDKMNITYQTNKTHQTVL